MLLFSPNWLFLYPGIVAILLGAIVSAMIVKQPFSVNGVRLGIDTLIYSAFLIVAGFQAVLFSMLSRAYATQEKLYPRLISKRLALPHLKLEWGLLIGAFVFLAGFVSALSAVFSWSQHGFGELVTEHIARMVIPSAVAMCLGLEIVLSSFLMSTLALSVRHYTVVGELEEYKSKAVAV
jgi:hypothetical protein